VNVRNDTPHFTPPNPVERLSNKVFGFLVGLGLGLRHNYVLQVRGRKTGRIYSTPVNILEMDGKRFLVAPRGQTQWVRNAQVSGNVSLKKGFKSEQFRLRTIPDEEKLEILKKYLDSFSTTVQRYFPIPAGSPPAAFQPLAARYPIFELIDDRSSR
jgi:deazaflavin-dependent oxidoreductase (nitroreductase family)